MKIELLDVRSTWSKIKAGFRGGKMWNNPNWAPNPNNYVDGRDPMATQAATDNHGPMKGTSTFGGGKTFSSRK